MSSRHTPVLLQETIESLDLSSGLVVVDATINAGGHSKEILERIGSEGKLIGFDADPEAILRAKEVLGEKDNVILFNENFKNMEKVLYANDLDKVDRILFDLGWSIDQIESGKGFSFGKDEPLLMTYGTASEDSITATDVLNHWSEETLADILYGFAGERYSRRIAKAIAEFRDQEEIKTTGQLVSIVMSAVPEGYKHRRIHPATKTFQALRMAVNDEVGALKSGLSQAWNLLKENGRMSVISFHDVEDRIVKRFMKAKKEEGLGTLISKKPITASREEVKENPPSRSAKLRTIKKNEKQ